MIRELEDLHADLFLACRELDDPDENVISAYRRTKALLSCYRTLPS